MGLFRGAVFHHGGVPENSPLTLTGRFPTLMGRFPTLVGRFPECLNGPFSLLKISGKQPIKKRGINQARKKSTKIKFLGPETARWGGGLPLEGVVAENFVPALESLSSLGFEERNPGCPGIFAGMSRTPGGVQKVCAKKLRVHFSFPNYTPFFNYYIHILIFSN